jgi:hypothetical protein
MIEIDLDHEVGATLNNTRIFMLAQCGKSRRQFFSHDDAHV